MVTAVRSLSASTNSVSAGDKVKNPSRMMPTGRSRSSVRTASTALAKRACRKPNPRAFRFRSTSSSRLYRRGSARAKLSEGTCSKQPPLALGGDQGIQRHLQIVRVSAVPKLARLPGPAALPERAFYETNHLANLRACKSSGAGRENRSEPENAEYAPPSSLWEQ